MLWSEQANKSKDLLGPHSWRTWNLDIVSSSNSLINFVLSTRNQGPKRESDGPKAKELQYGSGRTWIWGCYLPNLYPFHSLKILLLKARSWLSLHPEVHSLPLLHGLLAPSWFLGSWKRVYPNILLYSRSHSNHAKKSNFFSCKPSTPSRFPV